MGGSWGGHEGRDFSSCSFLERRGGLSETWSIIYYCRKAGRFVCFENMFSVGEQWV